MTLSKITLNFSCPDNRDDNQTDALTWSQQFIWGLMQNLAPRDAQFNMAISLPITSGISRDSVLSLLKSVIETFEAIRTVCVVGADGVPRRTILNAGALEVRILDVASASDLPDRVAAEQAAQLSERFETVERPQIRISLLEVDQAPKHLLLILSHLIVDAAGRGNLKRVLSAKLDPAQAGAELRDPRSPQAQADWEHGPAGQAAAAGSLTYWQSELGKFPASMFPQPVAQPLADRWVRGVFRSERFGVCVGQLARNCGVSRPAVVLALFSLVVGYRTGQDAMALVANFGNRTDVKTQKAVGTYVLPGPVYLPLTRDSFTTTVKAAESKLLLAYKHCRLPSAAREDVRRLAGTNGWSPETISGVIFNNHFKAGGSAPPSDRTEVSYEKPDYTFEWTNVFDKETSKLLIDISPPDQVAIMADTMFVSRTEVVEILRSMDLLAAALAKGERTSPWAILESVGPTPADS